MMNFWLAVRGVHSDPGWWRKVGVGGALMLTVLGYPWADGFLMQSVENSKRGFPTPLPPWHDWSVRYVMGVLGLLVDVTFFGLPLLLGGLVLFCAGVGTLTVGLGGAGLGLLAVFAGLVGLYMAAVFALGLSPIARLLYAEDGRIEEALGARPLRLATDRPTRGAFGRARLASLPAYLPFLLLAGLTLALARQPGVAGALLTVLAAWLMLAALFYGRLIAMQLYVDAERALRPGGYGRAAG
jgi:hypothetical protein